MLSVRLPIPVICHLLYVQHNYGMYSPAPSPFGNMGIGHGGGGGGGGAANLSHTSTTMLVPMHSQAGPHSVILGPGGPQMGTMT